MEEQHQPLASVPGSKKAEKKRSPNAELRRTGVAMAGSETVQRFGSANAEYIKGYTGFDAETGQALHDGLKALSQQAKGVPQKAGTAAEIMATNRDNAKNIINKTPQRAARTDDLSRQYGVNHPIVDRVRIAENGTTSYAQMKFENDPEALVKKIVEKDGAYAKYLNPEKEAVKRIEKHSHNALKAEQKAQLAESQGRLKDAAKHRQDAEGLRGRVASNEQIAKSQIELEVPTEQVEEIKKICRENATKLKGKAAQLELEAAANERLGKLKEAQDLREKAQEFKDEATRNSQLEERVMDAGVSQDEANLGATQPLRTTTVSILKTSHRAGLEAAKFGAMVGTTISVFQNGLAYHRGDIDVQELTTSVLCDTGKAAAMGYGTGLAGAAIKGAMQQSGSGVTRALANTNLPALVVSTCVSLSGSIKRYVQGYISEAELLTEVGEKGAGMLSSSAMAAFGQFAIPIPVVGAVIGGMVGYALSSFFYQSALEAARGVEHSRINLERVTAIETAARARIAQEQALVQQFIDQELPQLRQETQQLMSAYGNMHTRSSDDFAAAVNQFAQLLGQNLPFRTQDEFNTFMAGDDALRL